MHVPASLSATRETQGAQTFSGVRHRNVLSHIAECCLLCIPQPHWIVGVGWPQQEFDYRNIEKSSDTSNILAAISQCINYLKRWRKGKYHQMQKCNFLTFNEIHFTNGKKSHWSLQDCFAFLESLFFRILVHTEFPSPVFVMFQKPDILHFIPLIQKAKKWCSPFMNYPFFFLLHFNYC